MSLVTILASPASGITFSRDCKGAAANALAEPGRSRPAAGAQNNWKKAFFGWLLVAAAALVVGTAAREKVPEAPAVSAAH
jgi:hypothetical protein